MDSLLVLGLVPGTNIQISFQAWLAIAVTLTAAAMAIWRELKRRGLVEQLTPLRLPLHANQLHQRGS
jgi:hypothetical protein